MGRRLKQIKRQDLGENAKKVVDSLIANTLAESRKEEKREPMRCKVEIYEGSTTRVLVDSFVKNIDYIEDLIVELNKKYGANVQFTITNLYDDKVVSRCFVYIGGSDTTKDNRESFNHHMDIVRKIHTFKDSGMSEYDVGSKLCSVWARSYIETIYKMTIEEALQKAKDRYNIVSDKISQSEILSEDLNTNKDNINISNLEGDTDEE